MKAPFWHKFIHFGQLGVALQPNIEMIGPRGVKRLLSRRQKHLMRSEMIEPLQSAIHVHSERYT